MKKRTGLRSFKVGLEEDLLEKIYSYQESDNWCWAASVQMVLKCHKIFVSQSLLNDILNKDKDCFPDCPNDFESIAMLLDNNWIDEVLISAFVINGIPDIDSLLNELENNNPVIVGIWNDDSQKIGHAEVLTNIEYKDIGLGRRRKLSTKLFVLDPHPSSINEIKTGKIYDFEDELNSVRFSLIIKPKIVPSFEF